MLKFTKFFAAITITCAMCLPVTAQQDTANTVVANVNGVDITIGHMIVLRNNLPDQYKNLDDNVLFDGILDQVIQQTVLAQTIKNPTPAIALQLENEQRALFAGAAMRKLLVDSVTDDAIEAAYHERIAGAEPNREFNASHILVETEAEAQALVTELAAGADFAELAAEKSTGPSGPNGGQLGWFGPGMMVPAFEEAVTDLQLGEVSAPIQTQFGWHVIILNESRNEGVPTLEEVRSDLAEKLQQQAISKILQDLTDDAEITRPDLSEIDRSIISDTSLVQN